ncbi:MAG: NAD-dependent epimerase/dehydratase family protein, partial [bacterium]|nr:NAD-dependent epimerase/dehydratase family protein [bacterium]
GSHLLEEFGKDGGYKLFSFDKTSPEFERKGVEEIREDFSDFSKTLETFQKIRPDIMVHLGALPSVQMSVKEPVKTYDVNIKGTYNVLEAARLCGARRFVFSSSAAVYGYTAEEHSGEPLKENLPLRPKNPYGLAKKMGEEMLALWSGNKFWQGIDTVSLRFFNVFGPRQKRDSAYATAIERFLYQWKNNEPLTIVPPGTQKRDMVYVKDLVKAVKAAALSPKEFQGMAINIGSGKNYSILEIADVIGGKNYPRVEIEPRPGDVKEVLADTSLARDMLKWQAETEFEAGIEQVKKYVKDSKL